MEALQKIKFTYADIDNICRKASKFVGSTRGDNVERDNKIQEYFALEYKKRVGCDFHPFKSEKSGTFYKSHEYLNFKYHPSYGEPYDEILLEIDTSKVSYEGKKYLCYIGVKRTYLGHYIMVRDAKNRTLLHGVLYSSECGGRVGTRWHEEHDKEGVNIDLAKYILININKTLYNASALGLLFPKREKCFVEL